MKVYAPNEQYTGMSASVSFCNGVGETNDPHLLNWFRIHGYEVEELPEPEESVEDEMEPQEENPEAPEEPVGKEPDKETKRGKAGNQKVGE